MSVTSFSFARDVFTFTTTSGSETIPFSFVNIVPPAVIKEMIITVQTPTPGGSYDLGIQISKGVQPYSFFNKRGATISEWDNQGVPIYLTPTMNGGQIVITAAVGTIITISFTSVLVPASSSYNSKITGDANTNITVGGISVPMFTNSTGGYVTLKGIWLANSNLLTPSTINLDLIYSSISSEIPVQSISFVDTGSNSSFVAPSNTFGYVMQPGEVIYLKGDQTGEDIDFFIHYTV